MRFSSRRRPPTAPPPVSPPVSLHRAPDLGGHPLGPPAVRGPLPGPRSRELAVRLLAHEAPGVAGFTGERPPIVWEAASGARVRDADGNVYVDLTAGFGVVNVGHAHPRVVASVRAQAERLLHGMGDVFPHEQRVRLAERLAELAPLPKAQVYFATSGSEAVEIAMKTAHLATGRARIAALSGGYHGLSYGALRATSRAEFRAPFESALAPPTLRLPFPDPFRPRPGVAPGSHLQRSEGGGHARAGDALAAACLEESRRLLVHARSRGELPGAVVVEPILGREGIVVPPAGWLGKLALICRELDVLLIADEVFTGFGRTGSWFAVEQERVVPDVMVVGKGMAGGLPIAAAIASPDLFSVWTREGEALHTSTFLAHPVSCTGALASLAVMEDEHLVERSRAWGARLGQELHDLARSHRRIREARGVGMMWALEFGAAEEPASAHAPRARSVVEECLRGGVLVLRGGPAGNVLQITPPLVLHDSEWAFAVGVLVEAVARSD